MYGVDRRDLTVDCAIFGRVAFIPFLVAGDPDLETTATALQRLDAVGASIIELGVPYSVGTMGVCNWYQ